MLGAAHSLPVLVDPDYVVIRDCWSGIPRSKG